MKMFNRNFAYYSIIHVLVFFYIYSVKFVFFPISSRVMLSILGLIYILIKSFNNFNFKISASSFIKFLFLFSISIWSLFVVMYNNSGDYEFVTYPISLVLILLASFLISNIIKADNKDYFFSTANLIINVVLIQVLFALLMFIIPDFGELINSLLVNSDSELKKLEEALQFRLVGLGSRFFGSGVVNGFALMLTTLIIRKYNLKKSQLFRYTVIFIVIFTLGMMMARTTIIGFILSFIILFFRNDMLQQRVFFKTSVFMFYVTFLPLCISLLIVFYFPDVLRTLLFALEFGFELFLNYFDNGSLETNSSNILKNMLVFPTEIKTYVIGDGFYTDLINKTYYMRTDIGYLRLIYYFGLPGLFLYLTFQIFILKQAFYSVDKSKMFYLITIIYLLILNIKGFTDLIFLTVLFTYNKNK